MLQQRVQLQDNDTTNSVLPYMGKGYCFFATPFLHFVTVLGTPSSFSATKSKFNQNFP